ncbi:unnamed protein product [Owenia fusiformis]|uniref:Uncharacterized protein n=1 Tax=Owenia fusiformis TaxID=6347 RepID=A0A8S4PUV5_OWEFU|nr:unnamed protein product [Owenia fusiformis]
MEKIDDLRYLIKINEKEKKVIHHDRLKKYVSNVKEKSAHEFETDVDEPIKVMEKRGRERKKPGWLEESGRKGKDCREQIPPPLGWNHERAYFCWKTFETQEALDVHIACAHRETELCGVWGCGAKYCPNDEELLQLHRLRQHALSPGREEPLNKQPKRVLRAITVVDGPRSTGLTFTSKPSASTSTTPALVASTTPTASTGAASAGSSTGRTGDADGEKKDPLWPQTGLGASLDMQLLDWVQECLEKQRRRTVGWTRVCQGLVHWDSRTPRL